MSQEILLQKMTVHTTCRELLGLFLLFLWNDIESMQSLQSKRERIFPFLSEIIEILKAFWKKNKKGHLKFQNFSNVTCSMNATPFVKKKKSVVCHLEWVKESKVTLFGWIERAEGYGREYLRLRDRSGWILFKNIRSLLQEVRLEQNSWACSDVACAVLCCCLVLLFFPCSCLMWSVPDGIIFEVTFSII